MLADEWKNFGLSLDENGRLRLWDVYKNTTLLEYQEHDSVKPFFLFVRSKPITLWKIHNSKSRPSS